MPPRLLHLLLPAPALLLLLLLAHLLPHPHITPSRDTNTTEVEEVEESARQVEEDPEEEFEAGEEDPEEEFEAGEEDPEEEFEAGEEEVHTILYYTSWWPDHPSPHDWGLGEGSAMFASCPSSNCRLTTNTSLLPSITAYSALLFHSWRLFGAAPPVTFPTLRAARQRYILFSLEPASHCAYLTPWEETVLANFFNDTFTFRRDSDISAPYGRVTRLPHSLATPVEELQAQHAASALARRQQDALATKVRGVLWMASHCWTDSRREEYVKELALHIPVTVVGKCARVLGQESDTEDDLDKYYFYLAFENSKCKDYITEKFFRGLEAASVPVVLGGADYTSVAPPHSHINVKDFPSPAALASRLHHLMAAPAEYTAYFWWKSHYKVSSDVDPLHPHSLPSTFPCALCSHVASAAPSTVASLAESWSRAAGCEAASSYHCNRDRERWFPGRRSYRQQLLREGRSRIVDLQDMVPGI